MSGLLRNLLTILCALLARKGGDARTRVACHFWATPLDCGTRVLKSDKYLQLAEAAQLDFLITTRLIGPLLRGSIAFVNASQLVRFKRPITMFSRVRVDTEILYADDKCAYFSHAFVVAGQPHAEVLVKMKFKKGPVTVRPADAVGTCLGTKPAHLQAWDQTLEAMP